MRQKSPTAVHLLSDDPSTVDCQTKAARIDRLDRDIKRFPESDRFNPLAWTEGPAPSSWSFNFFSHGPQACPGADLAMRLRVAILTAILGERRPAASGATLNPHQPLPLTFDSSRVSIRLNRRH